MHCDWGGDWDGVCGLRSGKDLRWGTSLEIIQSVFWYAREDNWFGCSVLCLMMIRKTADRVLEQIFVLELEGLVDKTIARLRSGLLFVYRPAT